MTYPLICCSSDWVPQINVHEPEVNSDQFLPSIHVWGAKEVPASYQNEWIIVVVSTSNMEFEKLDPVQGTVCGASHLGLSPTTLNMMLLSKHVCVPKVAI